jgi:hypothetical protein
MRFCGRVVLPRAAGASGFARRIDMQHVNDEIDVVVIGITAAA